MLGKKMLLRCLVSAVVLTIAGAGFSKKPPVKGPVQEMDYDVTTDVVLGLPNGVAPVGSFQGALATGVALPADLSTFPPDPCFGVATMWNAILATPAPSGHHRGGHGDHGDHHNTCDAADAQRAALSTALQVMGTYQCALQIVRDESTSPPTVVSITPIYVSSF